MAVIFGLGMLVGGFLGIQIEAIALRKELQGRCPHCKARSILGDRP
jgi:hypothetical protein